MYIRVVVSRFLLRGLEQDKIGLVRRFRRRDGSVDKVMITTTLIGCKYPVDDTDPVT